MKTFEYSFSTTVEFSGPVREHAFVLRCLPRRGEGVTVVREELTIEPGLRYARQRDSFSNELAVGSARMPHDRIGYYSKGTVRIDLSQVQPSRSIGAHPLYRYQSPLATCDEAIAKWASDLGLNHDAFALDSGSAPSDAQMNTPAAAKEGAAFDAQAGMPARLQETTPADARPSTPADAQKSAQADARSSTTSGERATFALHQLGHAVHEIMAYEPGSTGVTTTASEAFAARSGVCQDFAHIMIAALRHAGIPARYVSGLAEGQGTTHAWAQAYIDGAWRGYDPTRDQPVDETYLPLAVGRDWSDCPVERGSFWGLVDQTQTVFMTMREL